MDRERVIQVTKRRMGEPIVKHLSDEEYNDNYNLTNRIMIDSGLRREFHTENVAQLFFIKIFEVLCKDKIEKITKQR
jgi:hypothetical protein